MIKNSKTVSKVFLSLFVAVFFSIATGATAQFSQKNAVEVPVELRETVPAPLRSWIDWSLRDYEIDVCPTVRGQRHCSWTSDLQLKSLSFSTFTGVRFSFELEQLDDGWVELPGGDIWPREVKAGQQALPVIRASNGRPHAFLEAGSYKIAGNLGWDEQPASLSIPQTFGFGLFDGVAVDLSTGRLQLESEKQEKVSVEVSNSARLEVFRLLTDDHPFKVSTRINLSISGNARQLKIKNSELAGFSLVQLKSALDIQMDNAGDLLVKVRPGNWSIDLLSTQQQPVTQVKLPNNLPTTISSSSDEIDEEILFVENELWSLQSNAWLRQIQVSGAQALDPSRTNIPREWHSFPAYNLTENNPVLSFDDLSRGDQNPKPDNLKLERNFWYDFSGGGWTVADYMSGAINRSARLNVTSGTILGAASISGQPQLISTLTGSDALGIGVKRGSLTLEAQSRLSKDLGAIPAIGWDTKVQSLKATVQLPPGWKSIYVSGVDTASNTWIFKWTLLDIFLVLLVFGALMRWVGLVPGLIGVLALALIQFDLPLVGISLLIMIAIDAVVVLFLKQKSWLRSFLGFVQVVSLAGLVVALLMFAVTDLRQAIYPQLERLDTNASTRSYSTVSRNRAQAPVQQQIRELDLEWKEMAFEDLNSSLNDLAMPEISAAPSPEIFAKGNISATSLSRAGQDSFQKTDYYEQKLGQANQTGEGLVSWSRRKNIRLGWDGPVTPDQQFSIIALSPFMNLVVTILKFLGLLALVGFVVFKFIQPFGSLALGSSADAATANTRRNKVTKFFEKIVKTSVAASVSALIFSMSIGIGEFVFMSSASAQTATSIKSQVNETYVPDAETLKILRSYLVRKMEGKPVCRQSCLMLNAIGVEQENQQLTVDLEYSAVEDTVLLLPFIDGWVPSDFEFVTNPLEKVQLFNMPGIGRFVRVASGSDALRLTGLFSTRQPVSISTPIGVPIWRVKVVDMDASGGAEDVSKQLLTLTPRLVSIPETPVGGSEEGTSLDETTEDTLAIQATLATPAIVHRSLSAGLRWQAFTTVTRVAGVDRAAAINVPLLDGERIISDGIEVKDQIVRLNFPVGVSVLRWASEMGPANLVELQAVQAWNGDEDTNNSKQAVTEGLTEIWSVSNTSLWHLQSEGLPSSTPSPSVGLGGLFNAVQIVDDISTRHFFPWPGESLLLKFEQPTAADGSTFNIDQHLISYSTGRNLTKATVAMRLTSSIGGKHVVTLPLDATDPLVVIDGKPQPLVFEANLTDESKSGMALVLSFGPGQHQINLAWDQNGGMRRSVLGLVGKSTAHNVEYLTVNNKITTNVPRDRWLLWAGLDSEKQIFSIGPAVLIWGYIPIALLISLLLANLTTIPLRTFGWFLLFVGLSQAAIEASIAVAVFLIAVSFLPATSDKLKNAYLYNFRQLFFALWAVVTIGTFIYAIVQGLLSSPDMKVAGFNSNSYTLNWFIDRWEGQSPVVKLITAPLWLFRVSMLLWALWLAFTVLNLTKWFMGQVGHGGFWRKMKLPKLSKVEKIDESDAKAAALEKSLSET